MDKNSSEEDKNTILFGAILIFLGVLLILVIPSLVPPSNYIVISSPNRTNISGGAVDTPNGAQHEEHSLTPNQKIEIATTTLNTISSILGFISTCTGAYITYLGYKERKFNARRDEAINISETRENEIKI